MKKDPVGLFFKYFVWASVAVVLLAVLLNSGTRRLGQIMQAEFRLAVDENRDLDPAARKRANVAPAVRGDEVEVIAKRDQAKQIELPDDDLRNPAGANRMAADESADDDDESAEEDLQEPEKDNLARPQPLDKPANAPNAEKPRNEEQADQPPPERAQKKITPERIAGYRTSLIKGVVQTERANAAKAIGEMGPQVAAQVTRDLCAALVDKHPTVRLAASEALERVNPKFRKNVLPIALDENPTLRTEKIKELTEIGIKGGDALPVVVFRLNSASKQFSYDRNTQSLADMTACLNCLHAIAKDDEDVAAIMMTAAAKGPLREIRGLALGYLPDMKIDDTRRVVSILTNAIRVDEDANRIIATKALAKIGSDARSAIDVLRVAKGSGNAAVREAATEALSKIEKTAGGKKKKG